MLFPVLTALLLAPAVVEDDGARVLFDGTSLDGWKQVGPGSFERADEGYTTVGGMGLLFYEGETFGDCVIRVVFKAEGDRDNSGVYVRIAEEPDDPWSAVHNGFEIQIANAGRPITRTGAVYTFAESSGTPARAGEWNTMEITLDGERILVSVNGEAVTRFDPSTDPIPDPVNANDPRRGPRPTKGYIGLQNHGDNDTVSFKEVSVRPLEKAGD